MERVLVNRNHNAEIFFYGKYDAGVGIANEWIIPLLKEFGEEITVDVICDYLNGDTRERFIDLLIGKKTTGQILPAELKRLQDAANKDFDAALTKVINQGQRVTAVKSEQENTRKQYEDKISSLNRELERTHIDSRRIEINRDIDEINTFIRRHDYMCNNQVEEIVEDEKRFFTRATKEKLPLSFASGFLVFDGDALQYDKAKVQACLAVYAETPQEVELMNKVKQLAALINEVYGGNFPGPRAAFYLFFSSNDGRVTISSDIAKQSIKEFAKSV